MSLRLDFVDKWTVDQYRDALDTDEQWDLKRNFMLANCESFPVEKLLYFTEIFFNITFRKCSYPFSIMTQVEEMSKDVFTSKHAVLRNRFYKTLVEVLRSKPQSHIERPTSSNETTQPSEKTHDNYSPSFTKRNQDFLFDRDNSGNMTEMNIQNSETSSIKKVGVPQNPSPIREDRGGSILDTAFHTIYGDYVLHEDDGEGVDNSSMAPNLQSISSKSLFLLHNSNKREDKSLEYHSEICREAMVKDNSSLEKRDSDLPLENHRQLKNSLVTDKMVERIRSILEKHRQSKVPLTTSKTSVLPAYDNRKSTSVNNTNLESINIKLEKDNGINPDQADEPLKTKLIPYSVLSKLRSDLLTEIRSKERDGNSRSREPDQKADKSRKNNQKDKRSDRACKKEGRSDSRELCRYSPERGHHSRKDKSSERGQHTRKDISPEHGHYSRKDKSPERGQHTRKDISPEHGHYSRKDKSPERGQHTRKNISPEHGHYSRKDKSPERGQHTRKDISPEHGHYSRKDKSPERGQHTRKDISPEHGHYSRKDNLQNVDNILEKIYLQNMDIIVEKTNLRTWTTY
ncbi:uncharacterized protein LOC111055077 [Nilaparvata lugens]|uniref:uncharacterized protein LOC111055077 n=1 Tax=Nilaparvata lugens TaxID=108931 RepID=UPI00193D0225|nr:uncharacterized protein LOC111055077 [Nilaparvata lugens]